MSPISHRVPGFLAVLALAASAVYGQTPTSPQPPANNPPPPNNPGGNPTGRPPRQPNGPNQDNSVNTPRQPPTPIFITGRVMLDDGSPVPNRISILRICAGGQKRNEGYTDGQGYFSLQLGANTPVFQDASIGTFDDARDPFSRQTNTQPGGISGGLTERDLMNCELRAELAGYQSQSVSLANRRAMDNPDVGVILMHRLGESPGTTISATTIAAPKDARKSYEKGLDLQKKNKLDEARPQFEKAVGLYPRFAAAWTSLGEVQLAQDKTDDARKSFEQAIAADSKYVPPYMQMAVIELRARNWQALADASDKALRLDPFNYPQAFFLNAVANFNLRKVDVAEESARRAQKLDSRHQIQQLPRLMGMILAERQDFTGAAAQLRDYLKAFPTAQDADATRAQLAQFEKQAQAPPPQ